MKLELSQKRKELFIKTIVWKQLVSYFLEQKNIDITKQLISVQVRQKKITIKVKGSSFKQELLLQEIPIKHTLAVFFESIGQDIGDYRFMYK